MFDKFHGTRSIPWGGTDTAFGILDKDRQLHLIGRSGCFALLVKNERISRILDGFCYILP